MSNVVDISTPEPSKHHFTDKMHGITDKLQSLSHIGHESTDKTKSGNAHPI